MNLTDSPKFSFCGNDEIIDHLLWKCSKCSKILLFILSYSENITKKKSFSHQLDPLLTQVIKKITYLCDLRIGCTQTTIE